MALRLRDRHRQYCIADGCDSSYLDLIDEDESCSSKLRFHRFPWKTPNILQKWVSVLSFKRPLQKHSFLCSKHFTADSYKSDILLRLKNNAVPTLFITSPVECNVVIKEEYPGIMIPDKDEKLKPPRGNGGKNSNGRRCRCGDKDNLPMIAPVSPPKPFTLCPCTGKVLVKAEREETPEPTPQFSPKPPNSHPPTNANPNCKTTSETLQNFLFIKCEEETNVVEESEDRNLPLLSPRIILTPIEQLTSSPFQPTSPSTPLSTSPIAPKIPQQTSASIIPPTIQSAPREERYGQFTVPEHIDQAIGELQELKDAVKQTTPDDEFSFFGQNVACQLRQMPLEEALECKDEIEKLLRNKRLKLATANEAK